MGSDLSKEAGRKDRMWARELPTGQWCDRSDLVASGATGGFCDMLGGYG